MGEAPLCSQDNSLGLIITCFLLPHSPRRGEAIGKHTQKVQRPEGRKRQRGRGVLASALAWKPGPWALVPLTSRDS